MSLSDSYLNAVAETLSIPTEGLTDMWSHGKNICIVPMVNLDASIYLGQKTFFLYDGIIREYFLGDDGSEHTLRIIQGPAFTTPSMNNINREGEPPLISQSLTVLEGRIWDTSFMLSMTFQNPEFFKAGLRTIINAFKVKGQKDVRRYECSAQERYALFNQDFPGVVNLIPLKYIASYLNMTPETISRIRNNFSKR